MECGASQDTAACFCRIQPVASAPYPAVPCPGKRRRGRRRRRIIRRSLCRVRAMSRHASARNRPVTHRHGVWTPPTKPSTSIITHRVCAPSFCLRLRAPSFRSASIMVDHPWMRAAQTTCT